MSQNDEVFIAEEKRELTFAEELRPPHFINGLVGMLQNVELVIHDPGAFRRV